MAERRKRRSPKRRVRLGRLLPVVVLVVVAYLYYRPISSWTHTRHALAERSVQVATLRRERAALEQEVARATSLATLARQARTIGLVRPGERLYIVKGIAAWRRAHARAAG